MEEHVSRGNITLFLKYSKSLWRIF